MPELPSSTTTSLHNATQLSVARTTALKPWFSTNLLQEGLQILNNEEISFFSVQRRYAGLIACDDIQATIQMAPGKGMRNFVFRDGTCSQCVDRRGQCRCRHTAALALLCLQRIDKDTLVPLADSFADSPWIVIAGYLHDRASMSSSNVRLEPGVENYLLRVTDDTGLDLQLQLSRKAALELVCLFTINHPEDKPLAAAPSLSAAMRQLQKKLAELAATPNERLLNAHGSTSKQQHLDNSLWMYIAHLLFLHLSPDDLQITNRNSGSYMLTTPGNNPILRLELPREYTWILLDKLSMLEISLAREQASQFSKVFFSNDAEIVVTHCCRLTDGTEYTLAELADKQYGTRYQTDNILFTLKPVPREERLCKKNKQGQLQLFAIPGQNNHDDHTGFTVESADISDFIKNNMDALKCGRHQVAPEITALKIVDMPDMMVIDQYTEKEDWCYLAGWYDLGNRKIQLTDLLTASHQGKDMLPGTTWLRLAGSPLDWFHSLGDERIDPETGHIKLRRGEFIALSAQIGQVRHNSRTKKASLAAFLQQSSSPALSLSDMPSHLRGYQRHGTAWLHQLHSYRLGGILADDMGLGKTHQTLALLALLVGENRKFLIVCPAAVLYHWPEKQQKFFSDLNMSVYHGSGRDINKALESNILVTTYGILNRDANIFASCTFELIIFDEMHYLKNKKTAVFAAASGLQSASVIGLTGTPVENSIGELATLLSLCLPGLFAVSRFRQLFTRADTPKQRRKLQKIVAPFILRRTRQQVLKDLPSCSEDIRLCKLSPDQVAAYRQTVAQVKGMVDQLDQGEVLDDFSHVLTTIIRLKQICDHLSLLDSSIDWQRYSSGKWDEFTRLIRQCMETDLKVVVFSQFTSMLDIIEAWLTAEKTEYIQLRGSVAAQQRSKRIQRFNTDKSCRICCASLLAGGTGIDLTGAQVVIHYDRWWNPAKEEQATARVHRMGQRHPVQVYKLVTVGTLEEKIHHLIEKKRALAAELLIEDDGSILKTLSHRELAGLFHF